MNIIGSLYFYQLTSTHLMMLNNILTLKIQFYLNKMYHLIIQHMIIWVVELMHQ